MSVQRQVLERASQCTRRSPLLLVQRVLVDVFVLGNVCTSRRDVLLEFRV